MYIYIWYYWSFSGRVAIKLYADDKKLYSYSGIRCPDDSALLQSGVNSVIEWSSTWQVSLAVNKCSVLHAGTHATRQYRLRVSSLPITIQLVTLASKLTIYSFQTHIHNMVSIANQRIYFIRRCFLSKDNLPNKNLCSFCSLSQNTVRLFVVCHTHTLLTL